jgi:pimeloyl-ACP methyl ester carboxylesterase
MLNVKKTLKLFILCVIATSLSNCRSEKIEVEKTIVEIKTIEFPGKQSLFAAKFKMYRSAGNIIVVPQKIAKGKPWIWRARFWGHEPQFDVAMLEKGYHIVYCKVSGLLGNPEAVERWDSYYKLLVGKYGFAKKPVLEGMSRGGMIIYNWAIANPTKVSAIYGDAPVMDLTSWPGAGSKLTLRAYKFKNAQEAKDYKGYPVDNLKALSAAGIPIIHVVGDADKVVPISQNTTIAETRYKKMGGIFKVIHKKTTGHHPHSLKDPAAIVAFIEKYVEKK